MRWEPKELDQRNVLFLLGIWWYEWWLVNM
jgi:hypothetical protein